MSESQTEKKRQAPRTAFKPGQSGNPSGRPRGSKNHATMVALALMEGDLNDIVKNVIDAAKAGDMSAAKLVIDKLVPASKSRPITIELPKVEDIASAQTAQALVVDAVANGDLLADEGQMLSGLIENQRRAIETGTLELRLKAIEESIGART
jgi:hypothetical protein